MADTPPSRTKYPSRAGWRLEPNRGSRKKVNAVIQAFQEFQEVTVSLGTGNTVGWTIVHEALKRGINFRLSQLDNAFRKQNTVLRWIRLKKAEYPILQNARVALDRENDSVIVYFVPWKE